ncbi:MAG: hypothetical protein K8I82_03125 [Anaerolineae bacterium]|nr:hypothetical protein [Anaerolineae bacterium]
MLLALAFLICTIFLSRLVLIITGRLKGPIIQTFERYGDDEPFFYPWPQFLLWSGLWLIIAQLLLAYYMRIRLPTIWIGVILLAVSFVLSRVTPKAREWEFLHTLHPFWLQDLWERTSRLERRRIAYMWMRLSWKARLYYNSSDQAFLQWADLIIMATLF